MTDPPLAEPAEQRLALVGHTAFTGEAIDHNLRQISSMALEAVSITDRIWWR